MAIAQRAVERPAPHVAAAMAATGARERPGKCLLQCDLAAYIADDATEPRAQDAQLPAMAVELFGVGVAPRHHRRMFGDAQVGLPQPQPMLPDHAVEPPDRRVQQFGVRWER